MKKTDGASTVKAQCLECGRELVLSSDKIRDKVLQARGYKGYPKRYTATGLIPWCKDCLVRQFESLYNVYGSYRLTLFYFCRITDFPFMTEYLDDSITNPSEAIAVYLDKMPKLNPDRLRKGFAGGDAKKESDIPSYVEAEVVYSPVVLKSNGADTMFIKWGRNPEFTKEDYDDLERFYSSIASQNGIITDPVTGEVADKVTELAIIEASTYLLLARKAKNRDDADDARKYYGLYDSAMASQLMRGRDVKDKQVGDALVQDIVKYCESEDFIEPWDRHIKYPHKQDVVDQMLLHVLNYVGKLGSDILNKFVPRMDRLPKEYKLSPKNDDFSETDTEMDKLFHANMESIADFKMRQHLSDDDQNEDSMDTDADIDTDEELFGKDED